MEPRLRPLNAVLDLTNPGSLNPAPLSTNWRVVGLEIPVLADAGAVTIDAVLFNDHTGHLLGVESKSGANIEPEQGAKLAAVSPEGLIQACAVTVRRPVQLTYEAVYACLVEHRDRITQGLSEAGLDLPVIAVGDREILLLNADFAGEALTAAFSEPLILNRPIANVIPFDHDSPEEVFDNPVRAELVAAMAKGREAITIRHITESVVPHFPMYGQRTKQRLIKLVSAAARRAAESDPTRLRYERPGGTSEPRVVVLRSPETLDRRGRTQSYQAVFAGRGSKRRRAAVPGQIDLFEELDRADTTESDETQQGGTDADDVVTDDGEDRAEDHAVDDRRGMSDAEHGEDRP